MPPWDLAELGAKLEHHVETKGSDKALELGVYKGLPKSYAVRGRDMVGLIPFVSLFLICAPAGDKSRLEHVLGRFVV